MDANISEENVIPIISIKSDDEDKMFRPNIGIQRPTSCHISEVYSVENYRFANFI
jgi:hypothetical protein